MLKWWPALYLDEAMPPGRDTPSEWIEKHEGQFFVGGDEDLEFKWLLADGEIITFICCAEHGEANLVLKADLTWSVTCEKPAEADECCILGGWQAETSAATIEDCVKALIKDGAEPGEYDIAYYSWGDYVPMRFDAALTAFVDPGTTQ